MWGWMAGIRGPLMCTMEQGGEKEMNAVLSVSQVNLLCPNHSVISWSPRVALREEREWVLALAKIVPSSMYILSP